MVNAQLELSCRVGSLEDVLEALDDGADINCNGGEPIFIAIMANNRELVSILVEKGADISLFEIKAAEHEDIVDALMQLAPAPVESDPTEDTVDAKRIRAFDRMIRNKGLAEPFHKKRDNEYPAFRDGLKWIAAEDCHAVVDEFLEIVDNARKETGDDGIARFLEDAAARIAQLSECYAAASTAEAPGDLLKDYLKERKKVA